MSPPISRAWPGKLGELTSRGDDAIRRGRVAQDVLASGAQAAALEHIDDVARYLTRHRISGGPRVIIRQEGLGAAQLIRLAQDEGGDLIVAGAYGHSRLGEWMFGGMTRDLLATSPICCLMSH